MKRRTLAPDLAALAEEIAGLSKAAIATLRERWKNLYGKLPPGGLGRSFLIRAIAYRLQEQACGGLKPSTIRLLARSPKRLRLGPRRSARRFARPRWEQSWSANGKGTRIGSRCSATACPSTASVIVRSRKSLAR